MPDPVTIDTVEMHTGGEPVRIVRAGYPDIPGATLLAKRRYAREQLDHLRRFLLFEPRGHTDMYGVIPVSTSLTGADLAVLFMHNEGYSTMCGHAVIALGRYALDNGLVERREPYTPVNIECPCGLVRARVATTGGTAGQVEFDSVPAFAFALDRPITTRRYGEVTVDIGYGGAFYAIAPAARVGLDVRCTPIRALVDAASEISAAVKAQVQLAHPLDTELAFLYGTILTDSQDGDPQPSANVCIFANAQVDRSPTGSGVTARLAVQHARGRAGAGETRVFESITGACFTGQIVNETSCGDQPAVVVRVAGTAHYSGTARFTFEPDDTIGRGFLLR